MAQVVMAQVVMARVVMAVAKIKKQAEMALELRRQVVMAPE